MLATILLLAMVLIASVTDLVWHKIYNWTTYSGTIMALGLSAAGLGLIPLSASLLGLLACGAIMLVCFVLFQVSGGDVKLIAMLGAFLGPQQGLEAMLWTFVLGACFALIALVWRAGPVRMIGRAMRRVVWALRLGSLVGLTKEEREELQTPLFLAPSVLAAVIIVRFSLLQYF
jgi:prepilin peptidase CpaA